MGRTQLSVAPTVPAATPSPISGQVAPPTVRPAPPSASTPAPASSPSPVSPVAPGVTSARRAVSPQTSASTSKEERIDVRRMSKEDIYAKLKEIKPAFMVVSGDRPQAGSSPHSRRALQDRPLYNDVDGMIVCDDFPVEKLDAKDPLRPNIPATRGAENFGSDSPGYLLDTDRYLSLMNTCALPGHIVTREEMKEDFPVQKVIDGQEHFFMPYMDRSGLDKICYLCPRRGGAHMGGLLGRHRSLGAG